MNKKTKYKHGTVVRCGNKMGIINSILINKGGIEYDIIGVNSSGSHVKEEEITGVILLSEKTYNFIEILKMKELPKTIVDIKAKREFIIMNGEYVDTEEDYLTVMYDYHFRNRFTKCFKIVEEEISINVTKEKILTKKEKEFLSNVLIDKNVISHIIKNSFPIYTYEDGIMEFIRINYKDGQHTLFRNFRRNEHYKNMEDGRKYTLDELGL